MAAKTVKVEGLRELEQALRNLPKATARNTLNRVLIKRAEPVRDAWQERAPRGEGHYADSVIVGKRLTRRQAREAKRDGKNFAEVYIGSADPAGMQLEFGNEHMAAQPHARQVWEQEQDAVLDGIGQDLMTEIDKSAARLARKAARLAKKG